MKLSMRSRGFTFLEVLVSMIILGMVVAGMFVLIVSSAKIVEESGRRVQAVEYGQRVLESLRMYVSAGDIPANSATIFSSGTHSLNELGIEVPDWLSGNYIVSYPYGEDGPREVTLTCTWTDE